MIAFEKVFDLWEQVFPLLPYKQRLSTENSDGNSRANSDLSIVGAELSQSLLVAWHALKSSENTVEHTFIAEFKLDAVGFRILYEHPSSVPIVNASVNSARNLLVFTAKTSITTATAPNLNTFLCIDDTATVQDGYETCLVEIFPPNRVFSLGAATTNFQHVKFVHVTQSKALARHQHRMVFFLEKEYIQLYVLTVVQGKEDCRITEQPRKERTIAKKHLWAKWDVLTQTLMYLLPRDSSQSRLSETTPTSDEVMLRTLCFGAAPKNSTVDRNRRISLIDTGSFESEQLANSQSSSLSDKEHQYFRRISKSPRGSFPAFAMSNTDESLDEVDSPSLLTRNSLPDLMSLSSRSNMELRFTVGAVFLHDINEIGSIVQVIRTKFHGFETVYIILNRWIDEKKLFKVTVSFVNVTVPLVSATQSTIQTVANPSGFVNLRILIDDRSNIIDSSQLIVKSHLSLLLLFVPGRYLQILDLSSGHESRSGLVSTKFIEAPPKLSLNVPFELVSNEESSLSGDSSAVLDVETGVAYSIRLAMLVHAANMDDVKLSRLMKCVDADDLPALLHALLSHCQFDSDSDIVVRIMKIVLLSDKYLACRADIVREYAVASTFSELRSIDMEASARNVLPMTTIRKLKGSTKGDRFSIDSLYLPVSIGSRFEFESMHSELGKIETPYRFCSNSAGVARLPYTLHMNEAFQDVETAEKEVPAEDANKITGVRRKWESLMSRMFASGQNISSSDLSNELEEPIVDITDHRVDAQRNRVLISSLTQSLSNALRTQISSFSASSITAFNSISVSPSNTPTLMVRSIKPLSKNLMDTRDNTSISASKTAKEYSSVLTRQIGRLWTLVLETCAIPSYFPDCHCHNCFAAKNTTLSTREYRSSLTDSPMVRSGSSSTAGFQTLFQTTSSSYLSHMQLRGNQSFAKSHIKSRFNFVSNALVQAKSSRASVSSTDASDVESVDDNEKSTRPKPDQPEIDRELFKKCSLLLDIYFGVHSLCCVLPPGFDTKLTQLGFHTLPRDTSLKNLDIGIFKMTDSFIKHSFDILFNCPRTIGTWQFEKELLMRIESKSKFQRQLKLSDDPSLVSDILCNQVHTFFTENIIKDDSEQISRTTHEEDNFLEAASQSELPLPLAILMEFLRENEFEIDDLRRIEKAWK